MPLKSFIALAKKNTPQGKPFDPSKPIANFIDATGETFSGNKGAGGAKPSWEQCRHLKKDPSGKHLCSQFFSNCVQEKCKGKFIRT